MQIYGCLKPYRQYSMGGDYLPISIESIYTYLLMYGFKISTLESQYIMYFDCVYIYEINTANRKKTEGVRSVRH